MTTQATANFSHYNTDPLAHVVPQVVQSGNSTVGAAILYYDSPDNDNPECFAPFFAIPSVSSTMAFKTQAQFSDETGELVTPHINDMFIAGTTVGMDYESILKGLQITNDVFMKAVPDLYAVIPVENVSLVSIDWQPITTLWQEGSKAANPVGNALGVDPATKGAYLAWAEVVEWIGSEYDEAALQ